METKPLVGLATEKTGLAVKPLVNWLKSRSMAVPDKPATCGPASQLM
jgi:hypothetical protein